MNRPNFCACVLMFGYHLKCYSSVQALCEPKYSALAKACRNPTWKPGHLRPVPGPHRVGVASQDPAWHAAFPMEIHGEKCLSFERTSITTCWDMPCGMSSCSLSNRQKCDNLWHHASCPFNFQAANVRSWCLYLFVLSLHPCHVHASPFGPVVVALGRCRRAPREPLASTAISAAVNPGLGGLGERLWPRQSEIHYRYPLIIFKHHWKIFNAEIHDRSSLLVTLLVCYQHRYRSLFLAWDLVEDLHVVFFGYAPWTWRFQLVTLHADRLHPPWRAPRLLTSESAQFTADLGRDHWWQLWMKHWWNYMKLKMLQFDSGQNNGSIGWGRSHLQNAQNWLFVLQYHGPWLLLFKPGLQAQALASSQPISYVIFKASPTAMENNIYIYNIIYNKCSRPSLQQLSIRQRFQSEPWDEQWQPARWRQVQAKPVPVQQLKPACAHLRASSGTMLRTCRLETRTTSAKTLIQTGFSLAYGYSSKMLKITKPDVVTFHGHYPFWENHHIDCWPVVFWRSSTSQFATVLTFRAFICPLKDAFSLGF